MLEGKTINLRAIREDDLEPIVEASSRIATAGHYWPINMPLLHNMRDGFDKDGWWGEERGFLLVTDKADRRLGMIGYIPMSHYMAGKEVGGHLFSPDDRRKGVMSEALPILCAYLFALHPWPRLTVGHIDDHPGTSRVAQRCGFVKEGVMRQMIFHRGKYRDLTFYGLLRENAPKLEDVLVGGE